MSAGFYLLVRFDNRQKLPEIINRLDELTQVDHWNAVDGFFSLVLKVNDDPESVVSSLKEFDGSLQVAKCELVSDVKTVETKDDFFQSFVFAELDKTKKDEIIAKIDKFDNVAACHTTKGDYDLVAYVQGETFDIIDRTVEDKIRVMDGVLRIKQDRIITLDKM